VDEVRQRKMTEKLAARIGRNQRTGKMSEEVGTWGVPVTNKRRKMSGKLVSRMCSLPMKSEKCQESWLGECVRYQRNKKNAK